MKPPRPSEKEVKEHVVEFLSQQHDFEANWSKISRHLQDKLQRIAGVLRKLKTADYLQHSRSQTTGNIFRLKTTPLARQVPEVLEEKTQVSQPSVEIVVQCTQPTVVNEVKDLLRIMPDEIRQMILDSESPDFVIDDIVEITMDLCRPYELYYLNNRKMSFGVVTREDIDHIVNQLHFGTDNRSGIEGTLHRISRILNRYGATIGLTLRVGRAVLGVASRLQDIIATTESILLLGSPSTGKTTIMRDIASVMAQSNRVIIVDTSCEIGGFGDEPHVAIGQARRMQVADIRLQEQVMIQAVQNHSPEVIVIDEIGTSKEVSTARTISQRGVVLCASAHGSMQSIMKNPILCNLLGGVETVTLGDAMASQFNNQKVQLQVKDTPIFSTVIELSKDALDCWKVYRDVGTVVKRILAQQPYEYELRTYDPTTHQLTKKIVTHDPMSASVQ